MSEEGNTPGRQNAFGTTGLPDINLKATIAVDLTQLLTQDEIERHIGNFHAVRHEEKEDWRGHKVVVPQIGILGDAMKSGAKVKILGYRTFLNPVDHQQILFAMVLVLTDTADAP
jgi:hypothetical protein